MSAIGVGRLGLTARDDRLEELYRAHASDAVRLAYLLTGDRGVAEDIGQEAFVRIARKVFGLRDLEHAKAYLFRTVLNLARGRGRKLTRERTAYARMDHSPEAQRNEIADEGTWSVLLQLPIRQRTALFLRYYLDQSEAEAAETLDCSPSALKSLVNRGLNTLREQREGG